MPGIAGSTFQSGLSSAASINGLPAIVVGPSAGSGANYDPGKNPTPGDTAGTDASAALQAAFNAAVASPYSTTRPAVVELLAGTYRLWNSGTTPTPILIKSAFQTFKGAGNGATTLTVETGSAVALSLTSGVQYTNVTGRAVHVLLSGATVSAISTSGLVLGGYPVTAGYNSQYPMGATTVDIILGVNDTLTVTFTGSLTATQLDSVFEFASATTGPAKFIVQDMALAYASGIGPDWASFFDMTISPTGAGNSGSTACAFTEGPVLGRMQNLAGPGTSAIVDFLADGCSGIRWDHITAGTIWTAACSGSIRLFNCNLSSQLNVFGGQTVAFYDCVYTSDICLVCTDTLAVGAAGPGTMENFPVQVLHYDSYQNGASGEPMWTDCRYSSILADLPDMVINIDSGFYKIPTSTLPAAWMVTPSGQAASIFFTFKGQPMFGIPTGASPGIPLCAYALGGITCLASPPIIIEGNQTVDEFFTGQAQPTGVTVPGIIAATIQKGETASADSNVLTITPPLGAGLYEVWVIADVDTVSGASAFIVEFTVDWTDSLGTAHTGHPTLWQDGSATGAASFSITGASTASIKGSLAISINQGVSPVNIVVKWVGGGTFGSGSGCNVSVYVKKVA